MQYDGDWGRISGVPEKGGIARFHTSLCEILRLLINVDKLDPCNLASAELATRWLVTIERATERNPRAPDWEGLEAAVSGKISSSGAAEVTTFMAWLSST